jgi:hypothetical protein
MSLIIASVIIAVPGAYAYSFTGTSVTYAFYKPLGIDVDITVGSTHCQLTWSFDFPIDADSGNGNMGYALVISYDKVNPAFQVHNNDGTCAAFPWGTHLYSPWDPLLGGWNGWHSSEAGWNTLVTATGWISCTGERQHNDNPNGIFTVTIDFSMLAPDCVIYWAVNFGAGGFWNYGGLSKYPTTWVQWIGPGEASTFETAEFPCPPPVGGEWIPMNTVQVLVQLVGSIAAISAIAASFVGFKRIKKKQD